MSITVTSKNCRRLESGRVAIGARQFSGRGGSYETYEIRLSAKAAAYLGEGDTVDWWDCDNVLPCIRCKGEIIKPDGRRIQLNGCRDVGIDTGHPPHMGLTMKTRTGVVWSPDGYSAQIYRAPWGTWYRCDSTPPGLWGVTSHEQFMGWAYDAKMIQEVCHGETKTTENKRLRVSLKETDSHGWVEGRLIPEVKTIGEIATDAPLILR